VPVVGGPSCQRSERPWTHPGQPLKPLLSHLLPNWCHGSADLRVKACCDWTEAADWRNIWTMADEQVQMFRPHLFCCVFTCVCLYMGVCFFHVCVCVYTCVCVCVFTCVFLHVCVCFYVCVSLHGCVFFSCVCVCVYTCVFLHVCVCVFTCVCLYMGVFFFHVCLYLCVFTCVCLHVDSHYFTLSRRRTSRYLFWLFPFFVMFKMNLRLLLLLFIPPQLEFVEPCIYVCSVPFPVEDLMMWRFWWWTVCLSSGKKVQVLSGHKDWISCCCVSSDCSMIASVGRFDRVSVCVCVSFVECCFRIEGQSPTFKTEF